MSIKIMSGVWAFSRHKGSELLLLLALADWADDDGVCHPDRPKLARKVRMSERQTQRLVDIVRASGEVWSDPGNGRGNATRYAVLVGRLEPEIVATLRSKFGLSPLEITGILARLKGDRSDTKGDKSSTKGDNLSPFSPQKGDKSSTKGDKLSPFSPQKGDKSSTKGDIFDTKGDIAMSSRSSIDPSDRRLDDDARAREEQGSRSRTDRDVPAPSATVVSRELLEELETISHDVFGYALSGLRSVATRITSGEFCLDEWRTACRKAEERADAPVRKAGYVVKTLQSLRVEATAEGSDPKAKLPGGQAQSNERPDTVERPRKKLSDHARPAH